MSDDHKSDGGLFATQVSTRSVIEAPADPSADRVPVLIVLQGHEIGRRYLLNEASLVLGRDPHRASLMVYGDNEISSAHAILQQVAGCFLLTDQRSTNGTMVNGQPLLPRAPIELQDGDRIFVGRTILKFTFQDELEEDYHHQLEQMANIDELTGLVVKRAFDGRLDWALDAARSTNSPVCVLMMDMDGLKKINDTHGHHVGAGSISQVGRILGEIVNPRGCVTRFGGDEFTAYLSPCPRAEGLIVGERIRAAVEDHEFRIAEVTVQPTISIGMSSMPENGAASAELIRAADAALYRAKGKGRNCVSD